MGKRVLLRLIHFGVCLALDLENGIPACVPRSVLLPRKEKLQMTNTHTKSSSPPRRHDLPLQQTHDQPKQDQWHPNAQARSQLTLTRPSKINTSCPGPSQYANVQTACADLSS